MLLRTLIFCVCLSAAPAFAQVETAAEISFMRDVAPILNRRCTGCHGSKKIEGDYRLHSFRNLNTAGESEETPIVPGKPGESELFRRLIETDTELRMPQEDDPLSAAEIAIVRNWIEQGARFDGSNEKASYRSIMPPRDHPAAPEKYRQPVPIYSLAFSPDGRELAVGGYHEVTIWNPDNGKLLGRIGKLPQRTQALSFTKDGSKLLVAGGSPGDYGEVCLVDLKTGSRSLVFGTFEDIVLDAAFSPDESFIAAGSADRSVRAWQTANGKQLWSSSVHSDWVTGVSISHDGRFVATSSRDFTVKTHEAKTGSLFTTYNGHQRQYGQFTGRFRVYDVEFSRDSPLAFSAGEGRAVRVWEAEKARQENGTAGDMEARFAKKGHTRYIDYGPLKTVYAVCVRGGNVFLAAGDGSVSQFEAASGKRVRDYSGHNDWVFAVDAHSKTNRVASGSFDGELRVWDTTTGEVVSVFKASPGF
jgi:WD40 repeat protein